MSEWNVGQTGSAGAGTRPGLAAALMLRVGNTSATAETDSGKYANQAGTASFSDVLKDRTGQQREPRVAPERRNGSESDSLARKQVMGAREKANAVMKKDARVDPSADSDKTKVNANKPVEKNEPAGSGKVVAETADKRASEASPMRKDMPDAETETNPLVEEDGAVSQDSYARVLALMLEALQAAMEDLSEYAAAAEGEGSELAMGQTQTATLPMDMAAALPEELLQLMQAAAASGETAATEMVMPEPDALMDALRKLLALVEQQKADQPFQLVAVTPESGTDLLAQMQSLAGALRALLQQQSAQVANLSNEGIPTGLTADALQTVSEQGDAAEPDQGDAENASGQGREASPSFIAATAQQTEALRDPSGVAQHGGVSAAAMAGGRTFGQEVSQVAQAKAPVMPQMPETPESARAITNQVVTRLQSMSGDERHEMELQLKPENLGKIQLRIVEERGQILAKFTAESEKVRAILESNMQLLRDSLEKNGLSVQELSVSVGQRQPDTSAEEAAQRQGSRGTARKGVPAGVPGSSELPEGSGRELRMSRRIQEYLYGPDSTMSLKA